jgi:membrane protein implicated in regulation of membrane protease activity
MLQEWLAWHHLIFLLPLVGAVLMILLGGLSDLHTAGADATIEGGTTLDSVPEAGFDAGVEGEFHGDSEAGHESAAGLRALFELFGVGHLPFSLVLQTVAILWGGVGLALVQVAPPAVAVAVAAVVTLASARGLAAVLARLMGAAGAPARRAQLVGKMGEVVLEVTPRFGVVHVRDERGTLYRLNARTEAEPLEPGRKVVVVGYDPEGHLYEVADPHRYLETGGH